MTAQTEKERQQLQRRFAELAEKSYRQNLYCFTGFLDMAQQDVLYGMRREISYVPCLLYGGNEGCERQMARFGSEEMMGYEEPFPIVCLEIRPLLEKFAEDLTHRDFLGACMNLGFDRSMLGDILIRGHTAYLYCTERIAGYVEEHLTKVRHTSVACRRYTGGMENLKPARERREYPVASERLDGVTARVFGLSREAGGRLFSERRVFVNGRIQENGSRTPKEGDIISVRGYGKFLYHGMTHRTRKGKCKIAVDVYV